MKRFLLLVAIIFIMVACSPAAPTPAGKISIPVPVSGQDSTPTPSEIILQSIRMINNHSGWGITTQTGRLLHTSDSSLTWQDVTPPVEMVRDTASSFLDASTAFVEGFEEDQQSNTNGILYATHDAGLTWSAHPLPFAGGSLQFLDASNGFAVTVPWGSGAGTGAAAVLYQTKDGGVTWSQLALKDPNGNPPAGAPPGSIQLENGASLAIHTPANFWLGGGLITTNQAISLQANWDSGQTWQTESASLPLTEDLPPTQMTVSLPVFVDDRNGFFTAAFTLNAEDGSNPRQVMAFFASHDGGHTWMSLPAIVNGVRPSVQADFVSPSDIFVPCGQAVCATQDGGATWKALASNVTFGADQILNQLNFLDSQNGWAVTSSGLFRSDNGGDHWERVKIVLTPVLPSGASAPVQAAAPTSNPTEALPTPAPTAALAISGCADPLATIQAFYAADDAKNWDASLALLADDVQLGTWSEGMNGHHMIEKHATGKAEIRSLLGTAGFTLVQLKPDGPKYRYAEFTQLAPDRLQFYLRPDRLRPNGKPYPPYRIEMTFAGCKIQNFNVIELVTWA